MVGEMLICSTDSYVAVRIMQVTVGFLLLFKQWAQREHAAHYGPQSGTRDNRLLFISAVKHPAPRASTHRELRLSMLTYTYFRHL